MAKLGIILKWLILLPVFVAVVLLAVANDQSVPIHLNPFATEDPVLTVDLALYQFAFIVFIVGALIGAIIAWSGQRKYRLRARDQREEASLWQARAEWSERRKAEERSAPRATAFLPRPERS
jgi:hypothetical protein